LQQTRQSAGYLYIAAQIEPTGELTIVKKGAEKYSIVLIDNGIIDRIALKKINRTEKWLRQKLREKR